MTLRAIVWHADEWLHRHEMAYREELSAQPEAHKRWGQHPAQSTAHAISSGQARGHASPGECRRDSASGNAPSDSFRASGRALVRETFEQWEARKSGIAVISKKQARERRRLSAAEFDLRFAR